jgi:hypothetical protein
MSEDKPATQEDETAKSGWKKVVEPIERKGGHSGADFSDLAAPSDKPGLTGASSGGSDDPSDREQSDG